MSYYCDGCREQHDEDCTLLRERDAAVKRASDLTIDAGRLDALLEAVRHELATLHGLNVQDGPANWWLDFTHLLGRLDEALSPSTTRGPAEGGEALSRSPREERHDT